MIRNEHKHISIDKEEITQHQNSSTVPYYGK